MTENYDLADCELCEEKVPYRIKLTLLKQDLDETIIDTMFVCGKCVKNFDFVISAIQWKEDEEWEEIRLK